MESLLNEIIQDLKMSQKKLFATVWILILALVGTNIYWIWYNSQWEYEDIQIDSKDNGISTYSSGEGDVNVNGIGKGEKEKQEERK